MTGRELGAELAGIALLWLPGRGLLELVPGLRRLPAVRRQGYAYLLGTVAVGGALFAASHLLAVPLRPPAIWGAVFLPAAAGLGAAALRRGRRKPRTKPRDRPAGAWRWLAWAGVAVACLGPLAWAVSTQVDDWDGRMTWGAQAAYLRAEGTVDAETLRDRRWFVVNPRYPPLLPLVQVAIQETFGAGEDELLFRGAYVAFFAALVVVLYDGARRAAGAAAATLAMLTAALLPFLSYGPGGATSTYNDLPLGAFYGGALVLLLAARPRAAEGLAAGLLLAGAVLCKNEGLPLALVALALGASRLRRAGSRRPGWRSSKPRLRWLAAALLPAALAVALLAGWRAGIPNRDTDDYLVYLGAAGFGGLLHGVAARLPVIAREVWRWSANWQNWHGFWALAAVVLAAGWRGLRRRHGGLMAVAAATPPALALVSYTIGARFPGLIFETWNRFLEQAMVPVVVVFAFALDDVLRRLRGQPPVSAIGESRQKPQQQDEATVVVKQITG